MCQKTRKTLAPENCWAMHSLVHTYKTTIHIMKDDTHLFNRVILSTFKYYYLIEFYLYYATPLTGRPSLACRVKNVCTYMAMAHQYYEAQAS